MTAPLRARAAGVACALAIVAGTAHAVTPPPTTEGHLAARRGGELVDVPLASTEVHLRVDGVLVDATVTQHFRNPYADPIEAVYLFPLPTGAAVDDLVVKSGDRTIHGQIAERGAAQRTYEAAKASGHVAALLTEQRPSLFTQSLANLAPAATPGATIDVTLHYVQRLEPQGDAYELVFPMVAPPRPLGSAAPDAAAVQPVNLPPGQRSSHELTVDVELDTAVPLVRVASPSHAIHVERAPGAPSRAHVTLAGGATIPNQDFVLRFATAAPTPDAAPALGALAYRAGDGDGTFLVLAQPPAAATAASIAPRELVIALDTSASMRGAPLAKAKEITRRLLADLRPDDTFQIVQFDDTATPLAAAPIAPKASNVAVALRWLDELHAGGSTDVAAALDTAFAHPHDPARLRVVVLVGDGYVGDEDAILARATAELGDARLFCFGVGSAVNRYLLEELARLGRGALAVVRPDEDAGAAIDGFARRLAAPVLTGVTIDWGDLPVRDVTPAVLPDVFLGAPLVLAGHYTAGARGTIVLHGTQGGRAVSLPLAVELPAHDDARPAIATVWARARIAELSRALVRKADPAREREILQLSLASHVLTRFTAFVAVDSAAAPAVTGTARRVVVPVEVPAAVEGIGPATGLGIVGSVYGGLSSGYDIGGLGYGMSAGLPSTGDAPSVHATIAPANHIAFGTSTISGDLDKAIVRRYLKRNQQKLLSCYEKSLLAHPGAHGPLVLDFTITPAGLVSASSATSEVPEVTECAATVVRAIEFPKPKGGGDVHVRFPLELQLPKGAP